MQQSFGPEWQIWIWMATVGASIALAVLIALYRPGTRWSLLPAHHIAAATIIGFVAWSFAGELPGLVSTVGLVYAGIEGAPGQGTYTAFAAVSIASVLASAVGVVGVLQRRPWATALGIGLCIAFVVRTLMAVSQLLTLSGQFGGSDANLTIFALQVAAQGVPPIVAIALLIIPIYRGRARIEPAEPPTMVAAREEQVGIIEDHSATAAEWPEQPAVLGDRP